MSWTEQSNREQLKQVSEAHLIEEGGHSLLVRRSVLFIVSMILLFTVWAIFTQVDEISISYGEIQPVQDAQKIQHLEGGIVSKVYVKDGDEVHANDVLLQLNPDAVNAELEKAQGRSISLNLDAERLRAFANKTPGYKVDWLKAVSNSAYASNPANQERVANLIKEDVNYLNKQNEDREAQRKVLVSQMEQRSAQLKGLETTALQLQKQLDLYLKEEQMLAQLAPQGYISQRDYIQTQRKSEEARTQLKEVQSKITEIQAAYQETKDNFVKLDDALAKEAGRELNALDEQLLETQHTIQRLQDVSRRLTVRAPTTGVVKGLKILPGSVISPGEVVMELIPTEGEMHVTCHISTHDVGHIKIGDPAQVKVVAYDYARYGSIKGKVTGISASTFVTKDNLPYYEGYVSLERNYVGKNANRNLVKPGMTVQVDIITGKKSVMMYLLKPITRALDESLHER